MHYSHFIERNPDIMLGKPILKGTRITVEHVMRKLADGYSIDDFLKGYPDLTKEQIIAVLQYAADFIAHEENLEAA